MSAPDEVPLPPLHDPWALPEWVRYYGGPGDPYLRVEDDCFRYEGGEPRMRRRVLMRPRVDRVALTVDVLGDP